jgi:hypothetical protein
MPRLEVNGMPKCDAKVGLAERKVGMGSLAG